MLNLFLIRWVLETILPESPEKGNLMWINWPNKYECQQELLQTIIYQVKRQNRPADTRLKYGSVITWVSQVYTKLSRHSIIFQTQVGLDCDCRFLPKPTKVLYWQFFFQLFSSEEVIDINVYLITYWLLANYHYRCHVCCGRNVFSKSL